MDIETIDITHGSAIVMVVWACGKMRSVVDFQEYDDLGRAKLTSEAAISKAKEHFDRWNKIHHDFREWKAKCRSCED